MHTGRAAYLAMAVTGWFVIVPLSFASLITGLVQSLGTECGLFRVVVSALVLLFVIQHLFAGGLGRH